MQLQSVQGLVATAIDDMAGSNMAWNGHVNMDPEAIAVMLTRLIMGTNIRTSPLTSIHDVGDDCGLESFCAPTANSAVAKKRASKKKSKLKAK